MEKFLKIQYLPHLMSTDYKISSKKSLINGFPTIPRVHPNFHEFLVFILLRFFDKIVQY